MSDGSRPADVRPAHLQSLGEAVGALIERPRDSDRPRPRLRVIDDRPRVVLAGGELGRRSVVNCELAYRVPDAVVVEADEVWEVLQQAPGSSLVILAGDLEDAPAVALERLLAHRHPELSVLTLYGRPLAATVGPSSTGLSTGPSGLTASAGG